MSFPAVAERIVRTAALGLRFWDMAEATSAIEGLQVEVFRRTNPRTRTRAQVSRGGVYVAHRVPSLLEFESSPADLVDLWAATTRPYRVEVRDPVGRFLPIAFDADLPVRGLFTWRASWLSPPQPVVLPGDPGSPALLLLDRVPLFSAPSRPVPEPLGVVRAHLREVGADREAAWSLLSVSIDDVTRGCGLADARGRVAVMFAYPEPPRRTLSSPPEARDDFSWRVDLAAFLPSWWSDSPPDATPPLADLAEVFTALETPGSVIESTVSPPVPLRLAYREPLTVRTTGATGANASYLWISA